MEVKIPVTASRREFRTTQAEKGDLVFIVHARQIDKNVIPKSATLGVFRGMMGKDLLVDRPYTLSPCESLGGVNIPIIRIPYDGGPYSHRKNFGSNGGYALRMNANMRIVEFGQENIIRTLLNWGSYIPHADWISKLKKPYLREEKKNDF